ncbi:hypothetical protein CALCODRAFT_502548 [Calocera cornea HHB12733]|uniref:Uncharacterized protein n=1 Tax=Calocera cornea HHB12733 TaxID=1353952 RepID=A0A165D737_9BASI|nr:hypothetical protein CALCODRAFT_502548 [Calocera cornea HHB12733]
MPIKAALKSPLYDFLGNAKGQGCVICPGKILASQNAADLHVNSSSHKRRLTRFQTYIEQARTKGEVVDLVDASVIVQKMDENIRPPPDQTVAKPKRTSKAPTPGNRKMRRAALRKAKEENGGAVVADAEAKAPSTEDPTAEKAKAKKTNSDSAQSGAVNKSLNKRKHAPGPEGEDKPKKRKTKAPAT